MNLGRLDLSAKRRPALMELVEDDALFEPVWTGFGSEPKGTRKIWRYRAGTLGRR